ncbi:MAG: hypothetical protein WCD86_16460 [Ktedonobacteraceae bacterium]
MQHACEQLLSKTELECIHEFIGQINLELRKVAGDDCFTSMFFSLQRAMNVREVQVSDLTTFRLDFKRLLKEYPRATLFSTSSLATFHLWSEKSLVEELTRFIHEGGGIKQILFVKSLEEMASVEIEAMIDLLNRIGITARIVNSTRLPFHLKKHFIMESQKKICWEIPVNEQGQVGASVLTTDEQVIANYEKIFEKLWGNV